MKLVVVGGQSRGVGKTSVAASIIEATRELGWTAFKITQYGHGVCSINGGACACAVEDPACPYAITPECNLDGRSDTSRFLKAGAADAFWVRARMGQLAAVIPELQRLIEPREFVIMESNSALEFFRPDLYLSVLHPEVADFKASCRRYLRRADAYVVSGPSREIGGRPAFSVSPPSYFSPEILRFVQRSLTSAAVA
ncbi:MAG: hypothetical protein KIT09_03870 [Bryobacteraceae bacterium]|nr:hypothetical protein [Bryobacteraceae bacterium]